MALERIKNTALTYLIRAETHPNLNVRFYRIEKLVAEILLHIVVDFTGPWEHSNQNLEICKGSSGSNIV